MVSDVGEVHGLRCRPYRFKLLQSGGLVVLT